MATKRKSARNRSTVDRGQGRSRQPPRSTPRGRLAKIPLPSTPAFLLGGGRLASLPKKRPAPAAPPPDPIEAMLDNAVSAAEADLLLGHDPAANSASGTPSPPDPDAGSNGGEVSAAEADELLGLVPEEPPPGDLPEPPAPPVAPSEASARSGASGAEVLNEMVDEIERDLERDHDRHTPPLALPVYGQTIGCWSAPVAGDAASGATDAPGGPDMEDSQ